MVEMNVMRVLLFVLDVSMLRECEGTKCRCCDGGGVVAVSMGNEYVGGTRGSGNVSSAADRLGMSVVRWMRGVGGMYVMRMWLARGGVGDEGLWIGVGLYQSWRARRSV